MMLIWGSSETDWLSVCVSFFKSCQKQKWFSEDAGSFVSTTSSVSDVKRAAKTTNMKNRRPKSVSHGFTILLSMLVHVKVLNVQIWHPVTGKLQFRECVKGFHFLSELSNWQAWRKNSEKLSSHIKLTRTRLLRDKKAGDDTLMD